MKEEVGGSNPPLGTGERQSWRAASDCKSDAYGLVGSNLTSPI